MLGGLTEDAMLGKREDAGSRIAFGPMDRIFRVQRRQRALAEESLARPRGIEPLFPP